MQKQQSTSVGALALVVAQDPIPAANLCLLRSVAPGFEPTRYRDRNRVERLIGRLKQHRRVAAAEGEALEALVSALGNHFSGNSIWDAANALRWMTAYETLYRFTTFFGHAEDFHHHVDIEPDGAMVLRLIPAADAGTVRTIETASLLVWLIASELDKRFQLGKTAQLEEAKPAIATRMKQAIRTATTDDPRGSNHELCGLRAEINRTTRRRR